MAFFFATVEDLVPVLLSVEQRIRIKYTPFGHFDTLDVKSFASIRDLPTLFRPAPNESAASCPKYVVTELDGVVASRRIGRYDGTTVWSIDQLENADSTVLSHGGFFGDDILLYGEVRTVHKTPAAQRLQRAFDTAIRKNFTKIKAFRVGKRAEALLDAGVRLTGAKQSPAIYDLAR